MQLQTVSGLQNYQQIKGNTEFVLHCTFSLMLWIIMITMFRIKIKRHKKNRQISRKTCIKKHNQRCGCNLLPVHHSCFNLFLIQALKRYLITYTERNTNTKINKITIIVQKYHVTECSNHNTIT